MTRSTRTKTPSVPPGSSFLGIDWHSTMTFLVVDIKTTTRLRHLLTLVGLILVMVVDAFWLPGFPESIFRFFQRVFHLESWAEIVIVNNLIGLFFFVFWIGVLDVLTILVVPREEGYLDLYLSKPLNRRAYILARLIPILVRAFVIGVLASIAHWVALRGAGLSYELRVFAGASGMTIAWAIVLIALVNLVVGSLRDSLSAIVIAAVPAMLTMLPGTVLMYRPDVIESLPAAIEPGLFPMNLVWAETFSAHWGLLITGGLLALACLLATLAAPLMDRE